MPGWLARYLERHQHPASRVLHLVGIPLAVAAVGLAGVQLLAWRWDLWWRPVAGLAAGYLLQWIGHRIEGNDMGELIVIKTWLGRPYMAVSPRYLPRILDRGAAGDYESVPRVAPPPTDGAGRSGEG